MFFLLSFCWTIAASFAFLISILSQEWISFTVNYSSQQYTLRRTIFYLCDSALITVNQRSTFCYGMTDFNQVNQPAKLRYDLAMASSAIAIGCAGLSILALWFSAIYLNLQRRSSATNFFLYCVGLLTLLTFLTSIAVWILFICEMASIGVAITSGAFLWPFWLCVGSSGGFLLSFVSAMISFFGNIRRQNKRSKYSYRNENNF